MALADRVTHYKALELKRGRPLIVYVTSTRQQAEGIIAHDVIPELLNQLQQLPADTSELDLLVISNGGDATVAWRIVSLIRERVKKFSILVPQAAFSAATLIALGADEIVMHPHGNLGPTDPQITNHQKRAKFGSEDILAFLRFAREKVGLTDQIPLRDLFLKFSEEVGFVGVGVAARSTQLSLSMGENMLRLHMKPHGDGGQSAKAISEALNSKYFHHGYPLNRTEAKDIGLPVAKSDAATEALLWSIWKDVENDLKLREPFVPLGLLRGDQNCQALFGPVPQLTIPPGITQQALQMLLGMYSQTMAAQHVPPTKFEFTTGLMESVRIASRSRAEGSVFASRQPDLSFRIQMVPEITGWIDAALPAP